MAESTQGLLARIIEDSALVARVRGLDARTLGRVVQHIGLEDAGVIVALASTEQLRDMFDEDLWVSPEPGEEEKFDGKRFAMWLEIMLESGEQFVADKLTELPEELVTLGFQSQVLVIDIDELALEMAEYHRDSELVEKELESCLYEEIEQYRVISRWTDHWDAVISVLLALDQNHHSFLRRMLERCCHASTEYISENGGLYEVLSAEEMMEEDAVADRDNRRAEAGYLSSADAAAFLGLPRVTSLDEAIDTKKRDAVTAAYFRSVAPARQRAAAVPEYGSPDDRAAQERFTSMLVEAGVVERRLPALPTGKSKKPPAFQTVIAQLRDADPVLYGQRTEELAYLANVLVAGSSFAGRAFRPVEAAEAAICTCSVGLDVLRSGTRARALSYVREYSADHLFRIGWHSLYHDVLMQAAECLERLFEERDAPARLINAVEAARADGKPWLIRQKLRPRGALMSPAELELYQHLIDRCPTLP
ncbi:MAG: DUF6178 family protein, partial [Polyangiaceae bacterium]|nr:DUF6178 family protein [Polyangiaceae bacterium]